MCILCLWYQLKSQNVLRSSAWPLVRIFFVAFTVTKLIFNICNFDFLNILSIFKCFEEPSPDTLFKLFRQSVHFNFEFLSISRTKKGHKQGQELLLLLVISKKIKGFRSKFFLFDALLNIPFFFGKIHPRTFEITAFPGTIYCTSPSTGFFASWDREKNMIVESGSF